MSLYLKYTCMKWIYHMRSFKYDWLKNIYIYTCINYNYRYMYIYTFFWFVLYARNVKIKVNQENRFLDFFWERLRTNHKRMRISLKYWVSNFPVLWYVIIFTDCLFFEVLLYYSNFLMALPYVALHIFDPLVDLKQNELIFDWFRSFMI